MSDVSKYLGRPYCLVAQMSQVEVQRHLGSAIGADLLRRIPRTCFQNQLPGKGLYHARAAVQATTENLDFQLLRDLQPIMLAITDFGADVILPSRVPVHAEHQRAVGICIVIEFDSQL